MVVKRIWGTLYIIPFVNQIGELNPPEELEGYHALYAKSGQELLKLLRDNNLLALLHASYEAAETEDSARMLELVDQEWLAEKIAELDMLMEGWDTDFTREWAKLSPQTQAIIHDAGCGPATSPPTYGESD